MTKFPAPQLTSHRLPAFDRNDWHAIESVFANAESCEFQQGWLEEPEGAFQPTIARTGWTDEGLWIYAELTDLDIFNDADSLNCETYWGDFFEVLVRPQTQDAYYEFHVTCNGQYLQLRYPDAAAFARFDGTHESLSSFFIGEELIQSHIDLQPENNLWRVLAFVPVGVAESGKIEEGDVWSFSFSRYDYTRGIAEEVLSSSSPHAAPSFHRQQEWGTLTFSD